MRTRCARLTVAALAAACFGAAQQPSAPSAAALDSPPRIRAVDLDGRPPPEDVLGVSREGACCAYPLPTLAAHLVVNDDRGGTPVLVAHDPVSAMCQAYDPVVAGTPLTFDPVGLRDGLPVLRDRQTGSYWSQMTGVALEGPLAGKALVRIPVLAISWVRWHRLHPDSWVTREGSVDAVQPLASHLPPPQTEMGAMRRVDRRLRPDALVLGVAGGQDAYAFPVGALANGTGVVNDKLDRRMTVVFFDAAGRAAAAYRPVARGKPLVFQAVDRTGGRVFVDDQTGSTWTVEGKAVAGPLSGADLPPESYTLCRWRVWTMAHPDTRLFDPRRWR